MDKKNIENLIRDYHWMRKEAEHLEKIVFGNERPKNWGVAQYGIEAMMPKGSNLKTKSELEAMDTREQRQYKRWHYYKKRVTAVERLSELVQGDKQLMILDCMIDRMSLDRISKRLGISKGKVISLKDDMLSQICHIDQNDRFDRNDHFVLDLFSEKPTG